VITPQETKALLEEAERRRCMKPQGTTMMALAASLFPIEQPPRSSKMITPIEVVNRSFSEELRQLRPDVMIDLITTIDTLVDSGILNGEVSRTLLRGNKSLRLLVTKGILESKIKIYHENEIYIEENVDPGEVLDRPFRLPCIDLCDHFSIFKDNYEAVACMLAADIITEENTDAEHSAWYPSFKTEREAKLFVNKLHEMFLWVTFWKSPLFNRDTPDPFLEPCLNAARRYDQRGSIAPDDKLIKQDEKLRCNPKAYVEAICQGGENPAEESVSDLIQVTKGTDGEKTHHWKVAATVTVDGVKYRWEKTSINSPDGTFTDQPWNYVGFTLAHWREGKQT